MSGNEPWSLDDWRAWRAENRRLMDEGWSLSTHIMVDGSVEEWAERAGVRIRRDPKWEHDGDGNYCCPVT